MTTKYVIYENPNEFAKRKGEFPRSNAIPATDTKSRAVLEDRGWRVAEEFEQDEATAETVEVGINLPRIVLEVAAFERGDTGAVLALEAEAAPDNVTEDEPEAPPNEGGKFWQSTGVTEDQRKALIEAEYGTVEELSAATDAQLLEVPGVGQAAVRNIRKALKQL